MKDRMEFATIIPSQSCATCMVSSDQISNLVASPDHLSHRLRGSLTLRCDLRINNEL